MSRRRTVHFRQECKGDNFSRCKGNNFTRCIDEVLSPLVPTIFFFFMMNSEGHLKSSTCGCCYRWFIGMIFGVSLFETLPTGLPKKSWLGEKWLTCLSGKLINVTGGCIAEQRMWIAWSFTAGALIFPLAHHHKKSFEYSWLLSLVTYLQSKLYNAFR